MDKGEALTKRGRALEDEFFYRVDKKLVEEMRAKMATEAKKQALAQACGILNDDVLERLVGVGITAETLVALTMVPLVRVAWADGSIDPREREAILKAADEHQCPLGSVGHVLLESWLTEPQQASLYEVWEQYTRMLCSQLPREAKDELKQQIIDHVRAVASAAGGFLGIHAISSQEEAVLERIQRVFDAE